MDRGIYPPTPIFWSLIFYTTCVISFVSVLQTHFLYFLFSSESFSLLLYFPCSPWFSAEFAFHALEILLPISFSFSILLSTYFSLKARKSMDVEGDMKEKWRRRRENERRRVKVINPLSYRRIFCMLQKGVLVWLK